VARQTGLAGNDRDVGFWFGGLAFDYELGPHRPVLPDPPQPEPWTPGPELHGGPSPVRPFTRPTDGSELVVEPAPVPEPAPVAEPPPAPPPTRTEIVLARPRNWPVGFELGLEGGYVLYPRPLDGLRPDGLELALTSGFVA